MEIQARLKKFPVPEFVWNEFYLDQEINDRGIKVDLNMAKNAIAFDSSTRHTLISKLKSITGLDNPNSVMQMKEWLKEQGILAESLDKKSVASLLETVPKNIKEVLEIRQKLAKSSVKKYQAMENAVCKDQRARGMFRFYGASRSGRWAGRLIQLQNLPQNHLPYLKEARDLVDMGDYEAMTMLYEDIPDTLSQLIRTAFIPREGMKFIVADFSAIEARVLSFLAKEKWRSEVFENNGDIYCASASAMFGVPVEKHGINAELRQKGKIAELALGYGGGTGALTSMGALEMGLLEEELQPLVDSWRAANSNIVRFWWEVDKCIKTSIKEKTTTETRNIKFIYQSAMLFIELPSGRRLSYVKPRIGENRFGGENVTYEGITTGKKWGRIESYGPKFVENIVQAISRDILAYALNNLSYCLICAHVHDEIIIEASMGLSVDAICKKLGETPPWIDGLLLRADGYECNFYKKD
ncbi:DNA polymerase [Peptostreptococcus sp. D1]|uniref:DNA polymerase n=1 Tax=Peptostreptococcus sp. D1 TaxID=72304 RepID=UPI0008F19145|nr:DNA polymerase [Peptostreptococcus sp. D1]SFE35101.1 DNA polymerase [Peptostreptococcus sp. D1]